MRRRRSSRSLSESRRVGRDARAVTVTCRAPSPVQPLPRRDGSSTSLPPPQQQQQQQQQQRQQQQQQLPQPSAPPQQQRAATPTTSNPASNAAVAPVRSPPPLRTPSPRHRFQRRLFVDVDVEEDEHFGVVEEDLEIQEDGLYSQFNAAGGTSVVKTSQPSSVSHHSASRRCCAALWLFLTQFVVATAPRLFAVSRRRHWLDLVVNGIPRGAGQVCFMNNPLTGVIIVAGLSVNATTQYTLLGLTGLISSTVLAKLLDVKWGSIRNGLFGYNGILVGYAVPTFMFDVNDPHASTASLWTAFVAIRNDKRDLGPNSQLFHEHRHPNSPCVLTG